MKDNLSQIYVLILALLVFLYFLLGIWGVIIPVAGVAIYLLYRLYRAMASRRKVRIESVQGYKVEISPEQRAIERRRAQCETIRSFAIAVEGGDLQIDRLIRRMLDWHLDYSRKNEIYHIDLYDYLIDKAKERLKDARADYLKRELRLTIAIVRQLIKGRTISSTIEWLREEINNQ